VVIANAIVAAWEPRLHATGARLMVQAPKSLRIRADATRIRQAVENVIDNALRFAPAGSLVTVVLRSDGDHAVIEVLDEGPGIDPEFVSQAFERFSRPDDGRDRHHGGTGLGLSIVQSIVGAHGGDVEIGNRREGGTYVVMRMPDTAHTGPDGGHQ
jgi:signal transduction histidine kinase